jgi:hypothetical protein
VHVLLPGGLVRLRVSVNHKHTVVVGPRSRRKQEPLSCSNVIVLQCL